MNMKNRISIAALLCMAFAFWSCEDPIVIDKVNEEDYANLTDLYMTVRDGNTFKTASVVEMYREVYTTSVLVSLPRPARKGVDVKLEYDADFLEAYNREHETDFKLLPREQFSLQGDGSLVVAPDQTRSFPLELSILPFQDTEEATYLLPLKLSTDTEGVSVSRDNHLVYLVKNRAGIPAVVRKEGEKKVITWIETNNTHPLNFLLYETEDGRLLVDYLVLFAFNINYNKEKGELYIGCNQQNQFILDNYDQVIKPLRDRGMKVAISILGNHDESGLAQLSDAGCRDFAARVAALVRQYGFDGVNFDDEYSNAPDLSNPLFAPRSSARGNRLYFETKRLLPDKDMISYQYGYATGNAPVDGVDPSEYMDLFNGDYGVRGVPYGNASLADCSYMSSEFAQWRSIPTASSVEAFMSSEYGWWMTFAVWDSPGRKQDWDAMNVLAQGILGSPLKKPASYYVNCNSFDMADIKW